MSGQNAASQPLDEVMLAMDVVDTLRNRSRLVEWELDADTRDAELKEKLRKIYKAQGIEVTDEVLEEGVSALRDDRFSYQPPPESFQLKLARIYVSRGRWGKIVLGMIATLCAALACYYFLLVAPAAKLPVQLDAVYKEVKHTAKPDEREGRQKADELFRTAKSALASGEKERAEQMLESLKVLNKHLQISYSLEIVNEPNRQTGVWRVPDANSSARNYYIVVESIGPDGSPVPVSVQNEETGHAEMVTTWGIRVDQEVFNRIARDKQDDGIIQDKVFGHKWSGYLNPEYRMRTTGAAITEW